MTDKTQKIIERIIAPALLAVALIVVSIWGMAQSSRAADYRDNAQYMYQRSFTELADEFNELETTLSKLMVVSSPTQYVLMLDDVWRLSGSAVSLMSQIPSYHLDVVNMNRFVVQLGDYSHSLTKKALHGTPMAQEDMKQLDELHGKCAQIASDLNDRIARGDIPVDVVTNQDYYTSATGEYKDEESIEKFPTLIYDGPFSESAEKQQPKGLSGNEVTEQTALEVAKKLVNMVLSSTGTTQSAIPTYDFEGTREDGRQVYVSITKQGAMPLYMMSSAKSGASGVPEQGESQRYRDAALKYLQDQGYGQMRATYAQYYGGAALINCAAVQEGVILYSDLIKVWVDREDMEIVGMDTRNYLFSHTQRQLPEPQLSIEEAEGYISTNIKVESREKALIPLTPNTECLCYEFKGKVGEEEYIIYINVLTGDEEHVLKIINSEDGQLVI
ncbi:MAG: germination protein YpeB [Clostridia bacterium]